MAAARARRASDWSKAFSSGPVPKAPARAPVGCSVASSLATRLFALAVAAEVSGVGACRDRGEDHESEPPRAVNALGRRRSEAKLCSSQAVAAFTWLAPYTGGNQGKIGVRGVTGAWPVGFGVDDCARSGSNRGLSSLLRQPRASRSRAGLERDARGRGIELRPRIGTTAVRGRAGRPQAGPGRPTDGSWHEGPLPATGSRGSAEDRCRTGSQSPCSSTVSRTHYRQVSRLARTTLAYGCGPAPDFHRTSPAWQQDGRSRRIEGSRVAAVLTRRDLPAWIELARAGAGNPAWPIPAARQIVGGFGRGVGGMTRRVAAPEK